MENFTALIDRWPSLNDLAGDMNQKLWTVKKWRQRDSIPSVHWLALTQAAKSRGIKVSMETLAQIQSQQKAA